MQSLMATIFFIIVMLHLVVGFGWLFYKMEIQKNKPKKEE